MNILHCSRSLMLESYAQRHGEQELESPFSEFFSHTRSISSQYSQLPNKYSSRSTASMANIEDEMEKNRKASAGSTSDGAGRRMKEVACPTCTVHLQAKLRMAEFRKEAVTYIEQGHVRVGMETVTDPAFYVTRNMQDFITWVDSSSIRRKVLQYHQKLDDYDVMA
ncbi:hypothetical protein Dimus_036237 [Dionaea muscipula]